MSRPVPVLLQRYTEDDDDDDDTNGNRERNDRDGGAHPQRRVVHQPAPYGSGTARKISAFAYFTIAVVLLVNGYFGSGHGADGTAAARWFSARSEKK
uniref:Uncharacterized protein n=1 Tax=Anopheles epiroticus TaxID=199890 RepID=A0A182P4E2_9DIPT